MNRFSTPSRALLSLLVAVFVSTPVHAGDWPNWRGPSQNGVSDETGLVDRWNPRGGPDSNLLWKQEYLAGRSTPIILGDRLYTLVRDQPGTELEGEKVVCADAATGEKLWEHRFNVYLSDVPDTRVGWSSVVGDPATGRVYAQGVCGYFCCLEGDDGEVVWERSLHEELGLLSTYGGRTGFPIVHEDTVITSAVVIGWGDSPKWGLLAKPAHRFLGFDKATGELRWLSGTRLIPYDTTYSTPAQAVLAGQRSLVFGSGDGAVWAMQAGTGKPIWKYRVSRRGLNVSPFVDSDGRVYTGHSEENIVGNAMGAFFSIDGARLAESEAADLTGEERWIEYQAMVGKSSPIVVDGLAFAATDSAKLLVFDTKTGEQVARKTLGRVMRASLLYADGKIYALSRGGGWNVLRPTSAEEGYLESVAVDRRMLRGQQVDASPIAAHGRVYVTTSEAMYCLAKSEPESSDAEKPAVEEGAEIEDRRPAQAQLVPKDLVLRPGEEQEYRVRLFNKAGEFLEEADSVDVALGVAGIGSIDEAGVYRAPEDAGLESALVLAEVKGLSVEARVHIVPPVPAQAQLVPYDTLLRPGQEQAYRVRLYDAVGEFLREAAPDKVSFRVAGSGSIDEAGVYRAPETAGHETALVFAVVDGFDVESRVRIVPPLPWQFDFEDGEKAPLTWVGGRIRYVPRENDSGEHYLAKPTELPTRPGKPTTKLGTRSRMWMGPHTLSNYTVQADIQLQEGLAGESAATNPEEEQADEPQPEFPRAETAIKLPTAGLINSRYTFALFGPSQEARLYSWCTHDKRTQAAVAMDLESGVWYRMKLSVSPKSEEHVAVVQAKVWPRGDAEPGEWTLEFTDKAPNLQGSPGLFGDAKEAEFFVDNITVTPNN